MAFRITRIDDMDGTDGAEVVTLELDRTAYEIDLCPRNRARLLRAIRPFIEHARALDLEAKAPTQTTGPPGGRDYLATLVDAHESSGPSIDRDLSEMARQVRD
jgi:hypothetical protein